MGVTPSPTVVAATSVPSSGRSVAVANQDTAS